MRPKLMPLLTCLFAIVAGQVADADDPFVDSVAPVLARRCLSCHNDQKTGGGLSMVDPQRLIDGGYVEVSEAESSHLVELISPSDGRAEMPKDSDPLTAEEITAIRAWIDAGAILPPDYQIQPLKIADRQWWSLEPIVAGAEGTLRTIVDERIDANLARQGLNPLPPADPVTLIRRVTYDLSGLPPTPQQVDAFVAQSRIDSTKAWRDLVDRLLAAPEFGEKWGQHWLDIARYAETHGYDKDQPRNNAWPYRDYVIKSFNSDKPFGQFAREQIAGDVLADDPSEGIVATGFLSAGPWDLIAHVEVGEGKLDGRIAKHLDRDEMAAAVFNVFQSTTIQCAQCHNHKFDPIESEDYYRVHAVFAGVDRANRVYAGLSSDQQRQKQALEHQRDAITRERDEAKKAFEQKVAKQAAAIDPQLDALTQRANQFPPPPQHGFHSQIAARADVVKWVEVDLGTPKPIDRIELVACYDDFNNIGAGFGFPVRFKVDVTAEATLTDQNAVTLFDHTADDFANPEASPVNIEVGNQAVRIVRVTATKLAERRNDFILALGELRVLQNGDGTNVAVGAEVNASDQIPPNARWSAGFLVDETYHRQSLDEAEAKQWKQLREQRRAIVAAATTPEYQQQIEQWKERLAAIEQELKTIPAGQFVYAVATDFPKQGKFVPTEGAVRAIHFLHRGDLQAPGARMLPGAPELWPGGPSRFVDDESYDEAEARTALAHYVTGNDNPLIWRSIANRIWQWTFGKPLVGTPNDFGRMGMLPTHPEILDLLAARLRDDPDQSIKSIVRELVATKAYRRASFVDDLQEVTRTNLTIDASNDGLWRFNRRRLTAEEFRDSVLAVSGTLRTGDRGGPSFKDFVIERPQHSPHYEYDLHDPNDPASHRRTIYRFVVRSQPQPMLTTLDCADPSISIARRDESTTALQALAQWNNRLVEAMSKRFSSRLSAETTTDDEAIRLACRLAWGRDANETERGPLTELLTEHGLETLCRVVLNASAMMYLD
ncbi:hypothetical protein Enr13x_76000 [Stieleria neptunia]|uniref:Cytochrome c domain-containing protein n=1 Tax=Stieleria neptunia TaxID=2527979 RepID=A0A518I3K8_9BACT|nr:DUF1549 domain-containing protein [Stieleria neptunia]QDV47689.1 hypothetical protein Enr13x_76000 [Stieleria neptunia]